MKKTFHQRLKLNPFEKLDFPFSDLQKITFKGSRFDLKAAQALLPKELLRACLSKSSLIKRLSCRISYLQLQQLQAISYTFAKYKKFLIKI